MDLRGTTVQVLDKGFVQLIDHMGSDNRVVQAARVSYQQEGKGDEADKKLINYLYKNLHSSPFEHVMFTFLVKAPIFVVRQWHRHRTWSYNEVSGRYSEIHDEYHVPLSWRAQDKINKQGSTFVVGEDYKYCTERYEASCRESFEAYQYLLMKGVAREQARETLPLSTYTSMYSTVDLWNLLHFIKLRSDKHAQLEVQMYSNAMKQLITPIVPWCMEAFDGTK